MRMAPETVKAIVKDLTAEEMELAQILDRYYKDNPTTAMDILDKVAGKATDKLKVSQKTKQRVNKTLEAAFNGGAITAMDGWAASTLWPWAENKVRREHPELTVGTKGQIDAGESAFYKKVAEEFEIAVSRSQSVSDEIHQGTLRKSKNPITKAFTMFRSDSAQTYNALRQKIGEAQFYARTGAKDKVQAASKKAVGAVVCALLMNTVWSEAVSFLMALWKNKGKYYRDDEDELTAESVIGEMGRNMMESIMGTVTFGDEIAQLIGNTITGDRRYDLEAPGLEQINEIFNLVQDLLQGNFGRISEAADVVKNGGNLGEYLSDNSGEILGEIKDAATKVATYFGLSINNVEGYLLGALKWISPELGTAYDDLFSNVRKDDLSKLTGDALKTRIGSIMESRGMGDNQEVAQILADLYEAGYKTAVPSDIPTSVSVNGENRKLSAYQQQFYSTVWREVVNDSLEEMMSSDRFVAADKESQAKMVDNLYDYAAGCAKTQLLDTYCEVSDAVAKISVMKMNGVAPSEYIVWKVTTSGLKTSEKMTILREWDMSEEAKKTIVGTIIGTDLETETGKPSQYAKFLSSLEEGMTVDQYLSMRTDGVDVEDYLEATESGLDSDDALNLATAKSQLEPDAGAERVSDLQKWRASVDFSDDVEDQLTALSMVMDDYEFINVEIANNFGIAPDAYVRFYEIRSQYDADGSGGYKQVEIQAAIDAQFGHLSQQQKAALWQLMNSTTKSAKKNLNCSPSSGQ